MIGEDDEQTLTVYDALPEVGADICAPLFFRL